MIYRVEWEKNVQMSKLIGEFLALLLPLVEDNDYCEIDDQGRRFGNRLSLGEKEAYFIISRELTQEEKNNIDAVLVNHTPD